MLLLGGCQQARDELQLAPPDCVPAYAAATGVLRPTDAGQSEIFCGTCLTEAICQRPWGADTRPVLVPGYRKVA